MRKSMIAIALLAATVSANQIATADASDPKSPSTQSPSRNQAQAPARNQDEVHVTVRAGRGRLGLGAIQISSELRKHLGAPADRGVLIDQVRPDSPAAKAGLQVGDVITDVDGKPCKTVDDIVQAMADNKKGDTVAIGVARGSTHVDLRATLEDDPLPWNTSSFDTRMWKGFGDPFDMGSMFGNDEIRRAFDEMRKRIEQLERGRKPIKSQPGTTRT